MAAGAGIGDATSMVLCLGRDDYFPGGLILKILAPSRGHGRYLPTADWDG